MFSYKETEELFGVRFSEIRKRKAMMDAAHDARKSEEDKQKFKGIAKVK